MIFLLVGSGCFCLDLVQDFVLDPKFVESAGVFVAFFIFANKAGDCIGESDKHMTFIANSSDFRDQLIAHDLLGQ